MDGTRQLYDSRASKLFEQYGGAEWPSVLLPNGFDSAMHFGDFGYGVVVVDNQGIVRAVNPHDIEAAVAEVMRLN